LRGTRRTRLLVALIASLHLLAGEALQVRSIVALTLTAAFAALIVFNYAVQTTFVPALGGDPGDEPLIAAFSMVNPRSLAWAVEMWGWALLGIATWLVSPVFAGAGLARAARISFAANGPVSVLGALITVARPGWVLSRPGLAAFAAWNALLLAMAVLTVLSIQRRLRADRGV
jgi:hypothetical protein